ncbi:MAG: hypothetical protein Q8K21_03290 [Hydrogenophaga sp.]|nr:hypothetical protein [Hydrogenophaga sp.]MDP2163237.1 hypothetical protein [Hydrogenophaga sp.]
MPNQKKAYQRPQLKTHGDLRQLTQSGTRQGAEVKDGGGDGLKTPKP